MVPIVQCNSSQGDETITVGVGVSSLKGSVGLYWRKLFAYSGAYTLTMQVYASSYPI